MLLSTEAIAHMLKSDGPRWLSFPRQAGTTVCRWADSAESMVSYARKYDWICLSFDMV